MDPTGRYERSAGKPAAEGPYKRVYTAFDARAVRPVTARVAWHAGLVAPGGSACAARGEVECVRAQVAWNVVRVESLQASVRMRFELVCWFE